MVSIWITENDKAKKRERKQKGNKTATTKEVIHTQRHTSVVVQNYSKNAADGYGEYSLVWLHHKYPRRRASCNKAEGASPHESNRHHTNAIRLEDRSSSQEE
jgi:hypothetical protein